MNLYRCRPSSLNTTKTVSCKRHCSRVSVVRTDAHVATLAASQRVFAAAGARVHRHGLLNDETIFHQLPDCLPCNTNTHAKCNKTRTYGIAATRLNRRTELVRGLTRVGIGDLIGFIGIEPDLLFATAQDAGGQALLEPEHAETHTRRCVKETTTTFIHNTSYTNWLYLYPSALHLHRKINIVLIIMLHRDTRNARGRVY